MALQCLESYGIRPTNDRHTSLYIMQVCHYIFKIALVVSEKVRIAFLYVLSIFWFRGQFKLFFFVSFLILV